MTRRTRFRYSEADKALMWDRWQKGDSMNEIARHFGRYHSSIQRILSENGGVRPAPRKRSRLALTLSEREEISRGLVVGITTHFLFFLQFKGYIPSQTYLKINDGSSCKENVVE